MPAQMTSNTFEISPDLHRIVDKWQTHERKRFNIFRMVSDTYYRETFHSDILKVLLEGHPDSLGLFINLLHTIKPSLNIVPYQYLNTTIKRERGRIDILIQSIETKRCIIVENKINNARDMDEQLSRYFNTTKALELNTDAIVYLSLDGTKEPSRDAYQTSNNPEVEEKLVLIGAFNNRANDLVTGWLEPLLKTTDLDVDFRYTILQYIDILKELGEDYMNTEIQKLFIDWIKNDNSNFMECARIAELFNQRHLLALRCMAERYNSPELKSRLQIASAKVLSYRGWMLAIKVELAKSNHNIIIEISDCNLSISLCVYGEPGDPAAKSVLEPFRHKIAQLVTGGEEERRFYKWPEDEALLIETVDELIKLFTVTGSST
jgi:hypothetical protein